MSQSRPAQNLQSAQPMNALIFRIYWSLFGYLTIFIFFALLMQGKLLIVGDILIWVSALAMIACRVVDIRRFGGTTMDNEEINPATFRKWVIYLLVFTGIMHAGARALAASGIV